MQYILTEEEYKGLVTKGIQAEAEVKDTLQRMCILVAENMPIKFWNNEEAKTWGCILSKGKTMGYCDECPVQDDCPHEYKRWSK